MPAKRETGQVIFGRIDLTAENAENAEPFQKKRSHSFIETDP
jgi:hypothetical protein